MSTKTKIIVLRKREIAFAGILLLLLVGLLLFFLRMFQSGAADEGESVATMKYTPGVYTSSVILNDTAMDVQVVVDENHINSISLVNLDESVETLYPLVKPAMAELSQQIIQSQSVDDVTYPENNQYTCIVLHNAIKDALSKCEISSE